VKKPELRKLLGNGDEKLALFNSRLQVSPVRPVLGIRTAELRKLAKQQAKVKGIAFVDNLLENTEGLYYEEVLLCYFAFATLAAKMQQEDVFHYLDRLLLLNDSWATNDSLASSLKCISKASDKYWEYLKIKLQSKNPWDQRFAIICFMDYYLDDTHTATVLEQLSKCRSNEYYVNMALAWAFATALAKQRELTAKYFFTQDALTPEVWAMSASKAIESFRISNADKQRLKTLRHEKQKYGNCLQQSFKGSKGKCKT
jgi:3-methyladenine DNA glycosylase AlkD